MCCDQTGLQTRASSLHNGEAYGGCAQQTACYLDCAAAHHLAAAAAAAAAFAAAALSGLSCSLSLWILQQLIPLSRLPQQLLWQTAPGAADTAAHAQAAAEQQHHRSDAAGRCPPGLAALDMQLARLPDAGVPADPLVGHQGFWHAQALQLNSDQAPVCTGKGEHHCNIERAVSFTGRLLETCDTGSVRTFEVIKRLL